MKKIFFFTISMFFISLVAPAQIKVLKERLEFNPSRKQSTDLMSQETIKADSTLTKTNNGFDVKKSKVDNMVYLNTNANNFALNKMPISVSTMPVEPMPIRKLSLNSNRFMKDSIIHFNGSDSLKNYKKH